MPRGGLGAVPCGRAGGLFKGPGHAPESSAEECPGRTRRSLGALAVPHLASKGGARERLIPSNV